MTKDFRAVLLAMSVERCWRGFVHARASSLRFKQIALLQYVIVLARRRCLFKRPTRKTSKVLPAVLRSFVSTLIRCS